MFQKNRTLIRNFLLINMVSGLTVLPLTLGWRTFLPTKFFLIAITCISGFVLIVWILRILNSEMNYPKIKLRQGTIAISTVLLFLAIQYFLIGIMEERIAKYLDQAAIKYCEQIGEIAEEYKALNGEYPTWQTMALLNEKPRQPLLIENEYSQFDHYEKKENGRYLLISEGTRATCSYHYRMEPPGAFKTYSIPEKEWSYSWKR